MTSERQGGKQPADGASRRGRPRQFDRSGALLKGLELFWERGYEGTSVSALTEALGISAPSLYAAFGSKEELFREAVAYYNDPDRSPTALALRPGPTVRQAVTNMLRDNAHAYTNSSTPRGCLVVLAATTYTPDSEAVRDLLAALRDQDRRQLQSRLDRAVSEGELPASANTSALATFVMTVLHGMSIQARDGADVEALDAVVDITMLAWDESVLRASLADERVRSGKAVDETAAGKGRRGDP